MNGKRFKCIRKFIHCNENHDLKEHYPTGDHNNKLFPILGKITNHDFQGLIKKHLFLAVIGLIDKFMCSEILKRMISIYYM